MKKSYKGPFSPTHPEKYKGNVDNIVYRSSWERDVMVYLDNSSTVEKWNSEECFRKYFYDVDKKWHRYYIDFWVKWSSGQVTLIEVKPKKQVLPPKSKNPRSKQGLNEAFTYIKNRNKWEAAQKIAADNNYKFSIWTEEELEKMGIKKKQPGKLKVLKPMRAFKKKFKP